MSDELTAFLDRRLIHLYQSSVSKAEVVTFVAKNLADVGLVTDASTFKDGVYYRESRGATGIGNYVAIPHAKSNTVTSPSVSVMTLDNEIPWETLDGNGVRVVILFAVGDTDDEAYEHLRLLSLFARKLAHDEVAEALLAASTVDDVIAAFN